MKQPHSPNEKIYLICWPFFQVCGSHFFFLDKQFRIRQCYTVVVLNVTIAVDVTVTTTAPTSHPQSDKAKRRVHRSVVSAAFLAACTCARECVFSIHLIYQLVHVVDTLYRFVVCFLSIPPHPCVVTECTVRVILTVTYSVILGSIVSYRFSS